MRIPRLQVIAGYGGNIFLLRIRFFAFLQVSLYHVAGNRCRGNTSKTRIFHNNRYRNLRINIRCKANEYCMIFTMWILCRTGFSGKINTVQMCGGGGAGGGGGSHPFGDCHPGLIGKRNRFFA